MGRLIVQWPIARINPTEGYADAKNRCSQKLPPTTLRSSSLLNLVQNKHIDMEKKTQHAHIRYIHKIHFYDEVPERPDSEEHAKPRQTFAKPMANLTDMLSKVSPPEVVLHIKDPRFLPSTFHLLPESNESVDTKVTKDTMLPTNNGSTEDSNFWVVSMSILQNPISEPDVDPVSAPMPNQRTSIPFPSRRNDERRSLLNSEPLPPLPNHKDYSPGIREELKVVEAKTVKSPPESLPRLNLQDLPPSFKNTHFWNADDKVAPS
ncbi:hypothetical protein Tco_1274241 [Tanacetum coccineum]